MKVTKPILHQQLTLSFSSELSLMFFKRLNLARNISALVIFLDDTILSVPGICGTGPIEFTSAVLVADCDVFVVSVSVNNGVESKSNKINVYN